jgi:hypothetical protein
MNLNLNLIKILGVMGLALCVWGRERLHSTGYRRVSIEHWWNDTNWGKLTYSETSVPVPLSATQIPHWLAWDRIRVRPATYRLSNGTDFHILFVYIYTGKAIPLQAWTGPEGSRRLRLPYF